MVVDTRPNGSVSQCSRESLVVDPMGREGPKTLRERTRPVGRNQIRLGTPGLENMLRIQEGV